MADGAVVARSIGEVPAIAIGPPRPTPLALILAVESGRRSGAAMDRHLLVAVDQGLLDLDLIALGRAVSPLSGPRSS